MSEKIRILYYALWIAHPVFQLGIAALMAQRGLHRQFKFFFGYIVIQLVMFAVEISLIFPAYWRGSTAAFYVYWACIAVGVACGFGVIHEVFVDVFRSFHTLRDLGSVLFKWAALVMLLVAGVVAVSASSTTMGPLTQAIITAQRCVRIVQIGMILFLLFFARYLGITRRQHSFGIALGFGSFAVVELALLASWVGNHLGDPWMSMVNMTAYNLSLAVWLGYFVARSPAREASNLLLQPQRWEQSLSDLHHPVPADSLIPMFEDMVNRALSRTRPDAPPAAGKPGTVATARGAAASGGSFSFSEAQAGPKS
jgi:low affinity Fe/Cu permease